jgi:proteasome lid subunit RPN8/RPN11
MISQEVITAANNHALSEYPKESCGIVVSDKYYPCKNIAEDPEKFFEIDPKQFMTFSNKGKLECILHSHPNGPYFPSEQDMIGQLNSNVPWGIIVTDGDRVTQKPIMWGANTPIEPLIGRNFMHGITDCYSLIRDTFRLGKEECAAQDIEWPFDKIELPEVPRDDNWWNSDKDLYTDHLEKVGFREISMSEAKPGDGFLIAVKSEKMNHAGLFVGNNQLLHHLPTKLSRREPVGIWARAASKWVRYEGKNA